ncbi:MAG TPA: class I SAM-dependent methyltransferase [Steroidobacteraceae bacterium]|nr:class I SAM-dependent methyltransferase [Steroidobacteraceae bacterium]
MSDYERIFSTFREHGVRLLEIGVAEGGSCELWSDFFGHPDTRVIGLDLVLPELPANHQANSRITLLKCDQNDSRSLRTIATQYGPFDIVIDDGSHRFAQTLNCFRQLFDFVRDGGYYVIEDWGVGYLPDLQHRFGGRFKKTMVTLITDIMRSIPKARISGYEVVLDTNKSLAFFRRGAPWDK